MGRNNYFRFKQFTIIQEKSAMKVGVDSVMLGAWANVEGANNILDIGSGTGLLSLMMAQRTNAFITAVEINRKAYEESLENFGNSPWNNRITCHLCSFQEFSTNTVTRFDHIISNPPYFVNSSQPEDHHRKQARHNDELPFNELIAGVVRLLSYNGRFSLIFPMDNVSGIIEEAKLYGLNLTRRTLVRHNPQKPFHRVLLEFSGNFDRLTESELNIEEGTDFSPEYKYLTRDFYLAF